jgi:hypothetical protein
MSPAAAGVGSRSRILGRLPQHESSDWAAVVVRYTREDWPPPEWLPVMAEGANEPYEAPSSQMPARERAA